MIPVIRSLGKTATQKNNLTKLLIQNHQRKKIPPPSQKTLPIPFFLASLLFIGQLHNIEHNDCDMEANSCPPLPSKGSLHPLFLSCAKHKELTPKKDMSKYMEYLIEKLHTCYGDTFHITHERTDIVTKKEGTGFLHDDTDSVHNGIVIIVKSNPHSLNTLFLSPFISNDLFDNSKAPYIYRAKEGHEEAIMQAIHATKKQADAQKNTVLIMFNTNPNGIPNIHSGNVNQNNIKDLANGKVITPQAPNTPNAPNDKEETLYFIRMIPKALPR